MIIKTHEANYWKSVLPTIFIIERETKLFTPIYSMELSRRANCTKSMFSSIDLVCVCVCVSMQLTRYCIQLNKSFFFVSGAPQFNLAMATLLRYIIAK